MRAQVRVFRGPNLHALRSAVRLELDAADVVDVDRPAELGGVLAAVLPGLADHACPGRYPARFLDRLATAPLGDLIVHLALELQRLAGTPVPCEPAHPGHVGPLEAVYAFDEEIVGVGAGHAAVEIARRLLRGLDVRADVDAAVERLAGLARDHALGPSTRALVEEAERRGIPWIRLDGQSLVQLGHGCHQQRIEGTITSRTPHIAVELARDKALAARFLRDGGIPAPDGREVGSAEEAVAVARRIGYPVVVKPADRSQWRGVALDLRTDAEVRDAYAACREWTRRVMVEDHLRGRDYRVLVVDGRVVAVAERVPGHVVGDGVHTVRQLVDLLNRDPRRGVGHEKLLTRLEIDAQAERLLERAGRTVDAVLAPGETLRLRAIANLSTGGTAIDRTDVIHPENADVARRAARAIGLDVAGIDLVTPDIARPLREVGGGVVEVHAAPGLRMHLAPTEGKPRDVAGPVLDLLFPPGTRARIPLAAIAGPHGATTAARMVAHILEVAGRRPGLVTTDGVRIGGEEVARGDPAGPWGAQVVLRDPFVDAAVLETARGGILREGLGFQRCDVGAVLGVAFDRLGLRGVDTREGLAFAERLVLEVVRDEGTAVMNADDPLVVAMAPHARGRPAFFSLDPENPLVRRHREEGGLAATLEDPEGRALLVLWRGGQRIPVVAAPPMPATVGGLARSNVANALAAATIAFALGVSPEHVRQGLRTFDTTFFRAPATLAPA